MCLAKIYLLEYNFAPGATQFVWYTMSASVKRIDSKCPSVKCSILIYRNQGTIFYEKILVRKKILFLIYNLNYPHDNLNC